MKNLFPSPWMWREKTKYCWKCQQRTTHRVWSFSFDWLAVVGTLTLFTTMPVLVSLFALDRLRRWTCKTCGDRSYV